MKYFDEEDAITEYEKQLQKKDNEIKRLKEEYVMLQNASDEVEEKKDKEIERLHFIIKEVRERVLNENKPLPSAREIIEILDKVGSVKE